MVKFDVNAKLAGGSPSLYFWVKKWQMSFSMSKQEVRHLGNSEPNAIHKMLVSKPAVAAQEREQSCWREVHEDICPMCGWNHKKTTNSKRVKKQTEYKTSSYSHFLNKSFIPTSVQQCVSMWLGLQTWNSTFQFKWCSSHLVQDTLPASRECKDEYDRVPTWVWRGVLRRKTAGFQ